MIFISTADPIVAELRKDATYHLVQSMLEVAEHHGPDVTPAVVQAIRNAVPDVWKAYVPTLVDLVTGMRRARRLGKSIEGWLFTNTSSQQSTHPSIALHHASRFVGCAHVVEVCSGAGVDARALARVVGKVTTFEADPATAAILEGNLRRAGIGNVDVVCAHVPCAAYQDAMATADGLWADPSRRDERSARKRSGASYDPPIGLFTTAPASLKVLGIKVGPGDTLDDELTFRTSSEYIGWRDECRERILWRGPHVPAVSLVDSSTTWHPATNVIRVDIAQPEPGMVLIEPHAAIMASGHVTEYFAEVGARVLDHRIGYGLCSSDPGASPLHRRFALVHVEHGIDMKRIRKQVRTLGWGRGTEVKKRGVDLDPASIHRSLDFSEDGPSGVILLARGPASRMTLFAQRLG